MDVPQEEWVTAPVLDLVTVAVEYHRDRPGCPVGVRMTGVSRKRSSPLWSWSCIEEDPRNVESVVGGVLGAVTYYRPTDEAQFLRACVGGDMDGPDPNQGTLC